MILITTGDNQLSGPIPSEIGQLTELTDLDLSKYNGCLRSFHALFFIYKLTYFVLFPPLIALNSPTTRLSFIAILSIFLILITTGDNDLSGQIPIKLENIPLCSLSECRAFLPPLPLCITFAVFF